MQQDLENIEAYVADQQYTVRTPSLPTAQTFTTENQQDFPFGNVTIQKNGTVTVAPNVGIELYAQGVKVIDQYILPSARSVTVAVHNPSTGFATVYFIQNTGDGLIVQPLPLPPWYRDTAKHQDALLIVNDRIRSVSDFNIAALFKSDAAKTMQGIILGETVPVVQQETPSDKRTLVLRDASVPFYRVVFQRQVDKFIGQLEWRLKFIRFFKRFDNRYAKEELELVGLTNDLRELKALEHLNPNALGKFQGAMERIANSPIVSYSTAAANILKVFPIVNFILTSSGLYQSIGTYLAGFVAGGPVGFGLAVIGDQLVSQVTTLAWNYLLISPLSFGANAIGQIPGLAQLIFSRGFSNPWATIEYMFWYRVMPGGIIFRSSPRQYVPIIRQESTGGERVILLSKRWKQRWNFDLNSMLYNVKIKYVGRYFRSKMSKFQEMITGKSDTFRRIERDINFLRLKNQRFIAFAKAFLPNSLAHLFAKNTQFAPLSDAVTQALQSENRYLELSELIGYSKILLGEIDDYLVEVGQIRDDAMKFQIAEPKESEGIAEDISFLVDLHTILLEQRKLFSEHLRLAEIRFEQMEVQAQIENRPSETKRKFSQKFSLFNVNIREAGKIFFSTAFLDAKEFLEDVRDAVTSLADIHEVRIALDKYYAPANTWARNTLKRLLAPVERNTDCDTSLRFAPTVYAAPSGAVATGVCNLTQGAIQTGSKAPWQFVIDKIDDIRANRTKRNTPPLSFISRQFPTLRVYDSLDDVFGKDSIKRIGKMKDGEEVELNTKYTFEPDDWSSWSLSWANKDRTRMTSRKYSIYTKNLDKRFRVIQLYDNDIELRNVYFLIQDTKTGKVFDLLSVLPSKTEVAVRIGDKFALMEEGKRIRRTIKITKIKDNNDILAYLHEVGHAYNDINRPFRPKPPFIIDFILTKLHLYDPFEDRIFEERNASAIAIYLFREIKNNGFLESVTNQELRFLIRSALTSYQIFLLGKNPGKDFIRPQALKEMLKAYSEGLLTGQIKDVFEQAVAIMYGLKLPVFRNPREQNTQPVGIQEKISFVSKIRQTVERIYRPLLRPLSAQIDALCGKAGSYLPFISRVYAAPTGGVTACAWAPLAKQAAEPPVLSLVRWWEGVLEKLSLGSDSQRTFAVGENNRYTVRNLPLSTSMGKVYLGWDKVEQRPVIIKQSYGRFKPKDIKAEADLLATMDHENIVRPIDYFENENGGYFVMEYVGELYDEMHQPIRDPEAQQKFILEGSGANIKASSTSLVVPSVQQALRVEDLVNVILDTGSALSFIHSKGYVHRDVKPGNILLTQIPQRNSLPVRAKLIDFGIANKKGVLDWRMSTKLYMPFELRYTEASDQFMLAATLHEILSGQLTVIPYRYWHFNLPSITIGDRVITDPAILRDVNAILNKALSVNPQNRFSSIEEFTNTLLAVLMKIYSEEQELIRNRAFPINRTDANGRRQQQPLLDKGFLGPTPPIAKTSDNEKGISRSGFRFLPLRRLDKGLVTLENPINGITAKLRFESFAQAIVYVYPILDVLDHAGIPWVFVGQYTRWIDAAEGVPGFDIIVPNTSLLRAQEVFSENGFIAQQVENHRTSSGYTFQRGSLAVPIDGNNIIVGNLYGDINNENGSQTVLAIDQNGNLVQSVDNAPGQLPEVKTANVRTNGTSQKVRYIPFSSPIMKRILAGEKVDIQEVLEQLKREQDFADLYLLFPWLRAARKYVDRALVEANISSEQLVNSVSLKQALWRIARPLLPLGPNQFQLQWLDDNLNGPLDPTVQEMEQFKQNSKIPVSADIRLPIAPDPSASIHVTELGDIPERGSIAISALTPHFFGYNRHSIALLRSNISKGEVQKPLQVTVFNGKVYTLEGSEYIAALLKEGKTMVKYQFVPYKDLSSEKKDLIESIDSTGVLSDIIMPTSYLSNNFGPTDSLKPVTPTRAASILQSRGLSLQTVEKSAIDSAQRGLFIIENTVRTLLGDDMPLSNNQAQQNILKNKDRLEIMSAFHRGRLNIVEQIGDEQFARVYKAECESGPCLVRIFKENELAGIVKYHDAQVRYLEDFASKQRIRHYQLPLPEFYGKIFNAQGELIGYAIEYIEGRTVNDIGKYNLSEFQVAQILIALDHLHEGTDLTPNGSLIDPTKLPGDQLQTDNILFALDGRVFFTGGIGTLLTPYEPSFIEQLREQLFVGRELESLVAPLP